jgi:hypothetical protein
VYESLVNGVPDFPMNFKQRWDYSLWGIFLMVQISAMCPLNERSRFVTKSWIAIPCDEISLCSRTLILRFLTLWNLLTHVYPRFMAMIPPWDFENHKVSIILTSNIPTPLQDFSSTHEDFKFCATSVNSDG